MNKLKNKSRFKVIIYTLIFLILFNFICPTYSNAGIGGTLYEPVKDLVCGIGDAIINILQDMFYPGYPRAVAKRSQAEIYAEDSNVFMKAAAKALTFMANDIPFISGAWNFLIGNTAEFFAKLFNGDIDSDSYEETFYDRIIPMIFYSPEAIFSNSVPALDPNFLNSGPMITLEGDEDNENNIAMKMRETIASWYVSLRNIGIVALLSILVYVSIRIILSSTAGETAKYKQMLKDWLFAMCILAFMHYMMAFLFKCTDMVTNLMDNDSTNVTADVFMTKARFLAEGDYIDENGEWIEADKEDISMSFGYMVIYVMLVFYTLIFTWKYLQRFIYLAFLTMISPLVAVTYPLDKISDGSAQAFNMWFKEYLYNVLLQPMHLILYTILITSAQDFAGTNMIYSIVALGFLLQAEKVIKSMFGFTKANGGGLSAAITGGALFGTMTGLVKKGFGLLPSGKNKNSNSSNANTSKIHYSRQANRGAPSGLSGFIAGTPTGGAPTGGAPTGGTPTGGTPTGGTPTGGTPTGGTPTGGTPTGGAPTGGTPTGGTPTGGTPTGGTPTGGAPTGGVPTGGVPTGGVPTGGAPTGGVPTGGVPTGGVPTGGIPTGGAPINNRGRGRGRVAKIAKGAGRTIRGVAKVGGKIIPKAVKFTLAAYGAAAGLTIGAAAGFVSDDYSNVAKLGATGLGVGAFAGSQVYNAPKGIAQGVAKGASSIRDTFQEGYYGKDYYQKLDERADKKWMKDKDVIRQFQRKYGDDYKQKMNDGLELRKAGFTEQSDIESAIKLMDKNPGLTTEQAANIMQFSKDLNKRDLLNNETVQNLWQLARDMTGSDAQADLVMKLVKQKMGLG